MTFLFRQLGHVYSMPRCAFFFVLLLAPALLARADAPVVDSKDLPRFSAVEPADALKTFQIKRGFKLEFAAHEPQVVDPIAVSFDENGRMFVVEMRDYSERRDEHPHLGRIRMLEDKDGDGFYETSTIFADDLPWPTGVFCYGGGVFVAATPDIIWLKDTDGDGRADEREFVFTGFGTGLKQLNVQGLMNCFNWGLDNRIHLQSSAGNRGVIKCLKRPDIKPQELGGRDFWFNPRTFEFGFEAGGGQYGFSYDTRGRKIVCNNSDHVRLFLYDDRYASRNPFYAMPAPLRSIAADGPAAEVFRISPDEPWRIIRTRWRVAGVVPGIVEGGGRVSGYFTGATGATVYRGDAYGLEFVNDVFIGDAGGNLVHRKKLHPDGVGLIAKRPDDEQNFEFLASKDTWFRPVNFANAPDGTLYVIDMYREIIEHPASIPEAIKKHLDLNSGNDRGRIYRIVPENFTRRAPPRLGSATTSELVATLEHPNGWHRDTAARLLYERRVGLLYDLRETSAVPSLEELAAETKSPLGRIHALHALDGLDKLSERLILRALDDADAAVREHAVLLSEKLFKHGVPADALWTRLKKMIADPDARVRLQLAFTLGEVHHDERIGVLAEIARRDGADPLIPAAVLSAPYAAAPLFARLANDASFATSPAGSHFLAQLIQIIGAENDRREVVDTVEFLMRENVPLALVRAFGVGLRSRASTFDMADPDGKLKPVFARAAATAVDRKAGESDRIQAILLLGLRSFDESAPMLRACLNAEQPQAVQLAAIESLARFSDPDVARKLLEAWLTFSPRARSAALSALLARPDHALALLRAVESESVKPEELSSTNKQFLLRHGDARVRALAIKLFTAKPAASRDKVIAQFQPALTLKGDTARGRAIYAERCVSCHRAEGQGHQLGPDLVTVKASGREKLLTNILDPNREVAPQYLTYVIETKDGESLTGIIASDTPTAVTLRQPFGKEEVITRSNIKAMSSPGQSLMPEGLEAGLTAQQLADLLEFIETLK
jgi:putative membrane-bound dehydrogenase-like protein